VNKPKREEMISFAIIEKDGLPNNGNLYFKPRISSLTLKLGRRVNLVFRNLNF
jgi:hypothetical protein